MYKNKFLKLFFRLVIMLNDFGAPTQLTGFQRDTASELLS